MTNYVAVHAGGRATVSDTPDDPGNGMFGEHSFSSLEIPDGGSQTLLVGERFLSPAGNHGAVWMRSTNRSGGAGDGTAVAGVCDRSARPNDWTNPEAFSSLHAGGVQFAQVDGAVRFVDDDIDDGVYERLARKDDQRSAATE